MAEVQPTVLCVDDDASNLELYQRALRGRYHVLVATGGHDALRFFESHAIAVVLTDVRMPEMDGAALLREVAQRSPLTRRVIVTGYADSENLITAINAGQLHQVVTKPWRPAELTQMLDRLTAAHHNDRTQQGLLGELERTNHDLIANERMLQDALDQRGYDLYQASARLLEMGTRIEALSFRDELTGLYNHRAFHDRLIEEVARATRYGLPLALVLFDIDNFAAFNHEHGHAAGDQVLGRLAALLEGETELQQPTEVACRFSGEEFALLMVDSGKAAALGRAMRFRDLVSTSELPGGFRLSVSAGVAAMPDDADQAEALLAAAETALKGAKRAGVGRVHFYDPAERNPVASIATVSISAPEADPYRPVHERIGEVYAIIQRERAASCLYVDLSRLRRIEQELGLAHHAQVYERAGRELDAMRGSLLAPHDLICRTSESDSYMVILSPRGGVGPDLEALASRVQAAMEGALRTMALELMHDQPRITVGSARVLNNSMVRPERLIGRLASEAHEAAKLNKARAALREKHQLQDIILGDGLTTVFQPIVDLGGGSVFGFEALTRGPRQSLLESPATLFSVADEVDLTFELDRACFKGALRNAVGLEPVHRLFLNLLPLSFYDTSFIEIEVGHLLAQADLTPANIVFEITERLAIENFTSFRRALAAYAAMGFGIAIDDVGTRHSNLETVMALRPDFIKLSDVLTRGAARSTVKREMLRSLTHIAEAVDSVIVAEGIETAEDLRCLQDLGIRYGQGYFIARPGAPFPSVNENLIASVRAEISRDFPSGATEFDDDGDLRDEPPLMPVGSRPDIERMPRGSTPPALRTRPFHVVAGPDGDPDVEPEVEAEPSAALIEPPHGAK